MPVRQHDDATAAELYDFVENAVEGLHRVGPDGTILWANRAELQMLGYGWDDYVGRHIADFHEDPATIDFILRTLLAGEALYDQPARLRCKDGSIRHVLIHSNGHFVDGQLRYTRCFTRDASERHERDQALAQRDAMLMAAPVAAALLMGPELRFRLVNNRYRDLIDTSGMLGQTFDEAFPHLGGAGVAEAVARVYASGVSYQAEELAVTRPDAEGQPVERFFKFSLEPLLDLDGRPEGVIVVAVDVTEHVRNRLAIEHAAREREQLLVDLGAASQAKDEFLAMLGHELRNPLSPIVTALQLMRMRGDGSYGREGEIIQRQVDHLVRLVDDLLDVSRIASGKVELRKETVALADVLNKAIEMASPLLEQKQHRLLVDVAPVRWHGDPARLAQVVSNLLSNAARYTPAGGHVTLATRVQERTLTIQVTDDGSGISPTLLPHIFDLFVQGNRLVDRAKGGLGIGLALVRNLVQMHGGEVAAYSAGEGRGSTFTLTLPESVVEEAESGNGAVAEAAPAQGGGPRVLVVDDNQDAADSLADLLGALGYSASVAYDPAHAIAEAAKAMPQVAILDIGLPGMDGFELAAHLRRLPRGDGLKLIALSGYGQENDKHRSREAGFAAHLVKPINIAELQTTLS